MAAEQFAKAKRSKMVWRSLYRLLVIQNLLFAGLIPLNALAMYWMGTSWYFLGVPYLLAWLFVGHLLNEWKCPGCQRSFLKRGQYGRTLPSRIRCVNCGLAMGEERDPAFSARGPARIHSR
jgi:predicted RNA-binding Zn-ribbon protein involved in translation (DUF1610 family)